MTEFKHITVESRGPIAVLRLNRPDKRNAVQDAMITEIEAAFTAPPEGTKVFVLAGEGKHFCAGLDLSEQRERTAFESVKHSRWWHGILEKVEYGGLPVVAALHGAVIGGGLEIASTAHVRVADESAFYQLPEGQRGFYVGGGASVRVSRIIGMDRMREMMLTGRKYDAADGLRLGLSHYVVPPGQALDKALELAAQIASNAEISNYMMIQALTRISSMSAGDGLFVESVSVGVAVSSPDAREGMGAFLERRQVNFKT